MLVSLHQMNNSFMVFLYFCIFIVIIFSEKCSCVDYYFETCLTRNCGHGPNISYPFFITSLDQPKFCGYKGFELNCSSNGYPMVKIHENEYVIEDIFYHNTSFRVYNSVIDDRSLGNGCLPQMKNISFGSTPFHFMDVSFVYLLSDCNNNLLAGDIQKYKIGCDDREEYAMLAENGDLDNALRECNETVVAPIDKLFEGDGNGVVVNYQEVMRRGFVLNWTASDCKECRDSGGRCGFNETDYHFSCYCPDRPRSASCISSGRHPKVLLIIVIAASASGVAIMMILFFWLRRRYSIFYSKSVEYQNVENFLKNYGSLAPKRYRYFDVKKMTNSFKVRLGQGGYGSVYKGKTREGRLIAVKILNESKGNGEEFINEVASISRTSHVNIVELLGFCFERNKRALIYEFMPNGSLEKFIYDEKSLVDRQLGWQTLYKISIGIARGLEYLHRGCNTQILHFDIKPHNILLDEEFSPKISDFGLSKLCIRGKSTVSMLVARGTIGYIAPEVVCRTVGGVSHKSDVYSYGMMILEMVGGRKNVDIGVNRTSEIYYPHWIYKQLELNQELGFDGISDDEEKEKARKMIIVSLWCIQTDPSIRPSMSKVVEMLEGSLESLQIPPKPYLYSTSRSQVESSSIQIP